MTRYVYSPFTPIADRYETSHRAGWALYWAHVLGAVVITTKDMASFLYRVEKTDEVFVYHGMEFRDALNFPGGMPDVMVSRAELLAKLGRRLGPKLISMDREMPDYAFLMEKQTKYSWAPLKAALVKSTWMPWPLTTSRELVLGDSHSLSQYSGWARVYRNDGQTLHGALSKRLLTMVDWALPGIDKLTAVRFYFGNIDVRHHLARYEASEIQRLVDEYLRQLDEVKKHYNKPAISIVAPLPIEDESRVLPKTGWFKGSPFYGNWAQRNEIRLRMTEMLHKGVKGRGYYVIEHPQSFYNEGGQLSFDVMEKPRSVHIAPKHYRLIQEGGKWTGV